MLAPSPQAKQGKLCDPAAPTYCTHSVDPIKCVKTTFAGSACCIVWALQHTADRATAQQCFPVFSSCSPSQLLYHAPSATSACSICLQHFTGVMLSCCREVFIKSALTASVVSCTGQAELAVQSRLPVKGRHVLVVCPCAPYLFCTHSILVSSCLVTAVLKSCLNTLVWLKECSSPETAEHCCSEYC